jgi:enolase
MPASIDQIHAREILDSRGNPTVEVEVWLTDGAWGRASVPSGASTGIHEAVERNDGDANRYGGRGVQGVVTTINTEIAAALHNNDPFNQVVLDQEMVLRDGTKNLGKWGANAILAVSLAISRAAASSLRLPYYRYIRRVLHSIDAHFAQHLGENYQLPKPFFNILNGGAHTQWQSTNIQEFMVTPIGAPSFAEGMRWGSEIYHQLQKVLVNNKYSSMVGDEGGFAPALPDDETAMRFIMEAIQAAGYQPGSQVSLAIDAAASEWFKDGSYFLRKTNQQASSDQLIQMWQTWVEKYPLISIEDGLAQDDWAGWQRLYQQLGQKIHLVGDDLLVTNTERIMQAISQHACNTLLMKVNQIGTLSESLQAICMARNAGWAVMVSHRSGETEDTSIADIAVGSGCQYIKSGSLARSERTAKYNQLVRIEESLR